jgi:hypothetical protein
MQSIFSQNNLYNLAYAGLFFLLSVAISTSSKSVGERGVTAARAVKQAVYMLRTHELASMPSDTIIGLQEPPVYAR